MAAKDSPDPEERRQHPQIAQCNDLPPMVLALAALAGSERQAMGDSPEQEAVGPARIATRIGSGHILAKLAQVPV
jgi:hypothetical protein